MKRLGWLVMLLGMSVVVQGSNVKVTGNAKINRVAGEVVFTVEWDQAWCDDSNWDAVWVFMKYRTPSSGWNPLYMLADGHRLSEGFTCTPGSTDGRVAGLFIQFAAPARGTATVECRLKCDWAASGLEGSFSEDTLQVMVQAIEMVYVPYGGYYLGDGGSMHSFRRKADNTPLLVDAIPETELYVKDVAGSYPLTEHYPQGYRGYYVMKYELTQEQYVVFFNSLTREQQERLLPLENVAEGEYVFGEKRGEAAFRNSIVLAAKPEDRPYVLRNGVLADTSRELVPDGRTLAAGYMSLQDLWAYASWAGLRPMSEMEYEKACRRPASVRPLQREYAWNANSGLRAVEGVEHGMTLGEYPSVGEANVNYKATYLPGGEKGPLRSGSFGAGATSAAEAGSGYWSVSEMSGNVRELCRNVRHNEDYPFRDDVHGGGRFAPDLWEASAGCYGYRGGGFNSEPGRLAVSDRTEADSISAVTARPADGGFRCVRTFEGGSRVELDAGAIEVADGQTEVCPGNAVTFLSTRAARVIKGVDVYFRYRWYVNGDIVAGATDSVFTCLNFVDMDSVYVVEREAWCAYGSVRTSAQVRVLRPLITPGQIAVSREEVCPDDEITIHSGIPAQVDCGLEITYRWFQDRVQLGNEIFGAYDSIYVFRAYGETNGRGQEYTFLRGARCYTGEAYTEAVSVRTKTIKVDSGLITLRWRQLPPCPTDTVWVDSYRDAGVTECNFPILYYKWYLESGAQSVEIPGEREASLVYSGGFMPGRTYHFRRLAFSKYGVGAVNSSDFLVNYPELTPGEIVLQNDKDTLCAGSPVHISSRLPAVSGCDLALRYAWEMGGTIVPGYTGETLTYPHLPNKGACVFRRLAITAYDTVYSNAIRLVPIDPRLDGGSIRVANGVTKACAGDSVLLESVRDASVVCGSVTYRWRLGDGPTAQVVARADQPFLKYKIGDDNLSYRFFREASYDGGTTWVASNPVYLERGVKTSFKVSTPDGNTISECQPSIPLQVSDNYNDATVSWAYDKKEIAKGYTCSVSRETVKVGNGEGTGSGARYVTVTYARGGCSSTAQVAVKVDAWEIYKCRSSGETTFRDCRDEKVYRMRQMNDGKCWMVENLTFQCGALTTYKNGTIFYERKAVNDDRCQEYPIYPGHKAVCPPGWRLPTDSDWNGLVNAYGGANMAGQALKGTLDWKRHIDKNNVDYAGTNSSGFNAYPYGTSYTAYKEVAKFWFKYSSTVWKQKVLSYKNFMVDTKNDTKKYSIRCVRDLTAFDRQ